MQKNIFFIPGLGADVRLFFEMKKYLNGRSVEWPKELGNNLEDLADRILKTNKISGTDLIVGFSFGGQVGLEMKKLQPSLNVVTLSSVREANELTLQFKLVSKLAQYIPNMLLKTLIYFIGPIHAAKQSQISADQKKLLREMAKDLDIDFFKQTLKLCGSWKSNSLKPDLQINGELDEVIPYRNYPDQVILKNAGHLITMTHAEIICREIENYAKS